MHFACTKGERGELAYSATWWSWQTDKEASFSTFDVEAALTVKPPLCSSTAHISCEREEKERGEGRERENLEASWSSSPWQDITMHRFHTPSNNSVGGCVIRVKRAGYERFQYSTIKIARLAGEKKRRRTKLCALSLINEPDYSCLRFI